MEISTFDLITAFILLALSVILQIWVRRRKYRRRNDTGHEEFEGLGATLMSTVGEGVAMLGSVLLVIWAVGVLIRPVLKAVFTM